MSSLASPDVDRLLAETRWLRRLARSLVRGDDVADDVVQETLLRACGAPLAAVHNLRAWLATVAAGVAARFARTELRRARRHAELPPREDVGDVAAAVARTEAQRRVMAALLALPATYRDVLLLRFQSDLGYAAIAARLGVPLETVRTRIERGLQQLRDQLDRERGGRAAWALPLVPRLPAAAWVAFAAAASVVAVAGWFAAGRVLPATAELHAARQAIAVQGDAPARQLAIAAAGTASHTAREPAAGVADDGAPMHANPVPRSSEGASHGNRAPASFCVGRIIDSRTGHGIAGAEIYRRDRFVIFAPAAGEPPLPEVRTIAAPDGSFRIHSGPQVHEELVVRAAGYATTSLFTNLRGTQGAYGGGGSAVDRPIRDLGTIALTKATTVAVIVVDAAGQPAAGAAVWLVGRIDSTHWSERLGDADAAGVWRGVVPRWAEATAWLVAWSEGACGFAQLLAAASHTITLGATTTLVIDCIDEHGAAVPQADVVLQSPWPWERSMTPGITSGGLASQLVFATQTDRLGRTTVRGVPLPAGPVDGSVVQIQATAEGHRGDRMCRTVAAGLDAVRLVLPHGERARVRGVVVDAVTQRPIAGAIVGYFGKTGADGAFGFADLNVSGGVVSFSVRAPGYVGRTLHEPVGGRCDPLHVRIELQRRVEPAAEHPQFRLPGIRVPDGATSIELPAAPRQPGR
jgi:RNA polymerase sigma-70 factor (ECF subfamily)